jgi:hypothetical protein
MDPQSIIATELPGATTAEVRHVKVAALLRDSSMRLLEAALAFGALATALLLGLGR